MVWLEPLLPRLSVRQTQESDLAVGLLRTQAEAAAKIHSTMNLEVLSGLLPEVRQRSDYNGMNLFEAERKKIEAYGELVRAGLEPQSVFSQLFNVWGLTGQISSQKTLKYVESNLVFPETLR